MKLFPFFLTACLGLASQNAGAAPYHLVHAFHGGIGDGRTPTLQSSLTVSGSVLYGMTLDGGAKGTGVVFKINTDGTGEKLLHTFEGWSILNMKGSKTDGAYPVGTPVLSGSTLYGVTGQGGSNGFEYGMGTVFSVSTGGIDFKVLHNFGAYLDGSDPVGSLVLEGSTLYGMTEGGGTNNALQGTIFAIQTDGSGYHVLYNFDNNGGSPQGSLALATGGVGPSTLYGMTPGAIFRINADGTDFLVIHPFTAGSTTDGYNAFGSVTISSHYLYGMTHEGGQNNVGTVFELNLIGSVFQILHSFSLSDAAQPWGDLALSGGTLYGMTYYGVTNYYHSKTLPAVGSGAVIQINTNGSDYQVMHTFVFPAVVGDGSLPFGTPIVSGSKLYGMTSLGGSSGLPLGSTDGGCIFSLTLPASTSGGGGVAPMITTTSPLPNGKLGVAYRQQLAASGGATPYTWALSSGHLPPGLTLTAGGVLAGKPTAGDIAAFSIKVTGHDKLFSTMAFGLTIEVNPTLTITAPKAGLKVTAPTLTVSGKASDPVGGVAGVYFQLNGGAWSEAQSADGYANWDFSSLPLAADSNVFSAYAVDTFGNHSKTNTVKFEYYVTGPLIVETNGIGTFMPNDNGKDLQIGATFPITAKPGRGYYFVNWANGSGTVLGTKALLKFVMESNLTLVANFEAAPRAALAHDVDTAKPFREVAGTYYGLFAPPESARQIANSGAIRVTLTESGSFSGKLLLGSDSLPFIGSFDASGTARIILAQKKINLNAALQLDFTHPSVTGALTDGAFVAKIAAYRGVAGNFQGTYPVVITGPNASTSATGTVTVDGRATATFAGALPDGTRASQSSLVSPDGYWPLYLQLHSASPSETGSLWAWSQLTNGMIRSLPTAATWISGTNHTAVQIIGSGRQPLNQQ